MNEFTHPAKGRPDTMAVHAGENRWSGSITTPIAYSSTFVFDNVADLIAFGKNELDHHEYGRYSNPTRQTVERKLASLEEAERCILFDCGMSAVTSTVFGHCSQGQHFVVTDDAYKQTLNFAANVAPRLGVTATVVPMGDYEAMDRAVGKNTVMIISESPTNPYLNIADNEKIVAIAKKHGVLSVIDNTFATPHNQRPIAQGIDIVIESTTKYLGGHNDILGGAVCGRDDLIEPIFEWQKVTGGTLDPMSCYLLIRGLKTFGVRIDRLNRNALRIAGWLEKHPRIKRVYYPGLPSHHDHELAKRQMTGFGAVVTIEVDGDLDATLRFIDGLKLCMIGPSLGGPETLITHPALNSYYKLTREERYKLGIIDELVRISVGLEDPDDIIDDFEQSLAAL